MAAGSYVLRRTYVDGDILAASDYVADHQQHIDNQDPQHTDDYSINLTQMRTFTDTGDVNSESLATTLAGELERLRYQVKHIKEKINGASITQWYSKSYSSNVANASITSAKLANGATFIQYLRTGGSNVAINEVSNTTLVSQAITLTRTRVRIGVSANQLAASGTAGTYFISFRIRRDATILTTQSSYVSLQSAAGGEDEARMVFFYIDSPGPGTYTYSVVAQTSSSAVISVLGEYTLVLEEIA